MRLRSLTSCYSDINDCGNHIKNISNHSKYNNVHMYIKRLDCFLHLFLHRKENGCRFCYQINDLLKITIFEIHKAKTIHRSRETYNNPILDTFHLENNIFYPSKWNRNVMEMWSVEKASSFQGQIVKSRRYDSANQKKNALR